MLRIAEGKDALLGARFFLVAACSADGGIKTAGFQSLLQGLGFHHLGMHAGAMRLRPDAIAHPVGIDVHAQLDSGFTGTPITKRDHLAELPRGIHMQHRNRWPRRRECLEQQMQQHRAVFADGIQQHRTATLRRDLAQDVQAFRFQTIQIVETEGRRMGRIHGGAQDSAPPVITVPPAPLPSPGTRLRTVPARTPASAPWPRSGHP